VSVNEKSEVVMIRLGELDTTTVKTRVELSPEAIDEYAANVVKGIEMPPGKVVEIDGRKVLVGGLHRLRALQRAGRQEMACLVSTGTKWDALATGIADNATHGVRLSMKDRRHNIGLLLKERPKASDSDIAAVAHADPKTVKSVRDELEATKEIPRTDERVGRDGRTRKVPQREQQPAEKSTGYPACQHEWENDGHGSRYCAKCNAPHPGDVSDGDGTAAAVNAPAEGQPARRKFPPKKPAANYLEDAGIAAAKILNIIGHANDAGAADECPQHYRRCQGLISNLVRELAAWERALLAQ
jgi:hypothetical protein